MPGDATRAWSAGTAWRCRPVRLAALVVALVAVLTASAVACVDSDDGRTLRPPTADQTTTTTVAPTSEVGTGEASGSGGAAGTTPPTGEPLRLTSSVVGEGGELPVRHTCRGDDVSPPLQWTGVPDGTVELAVVVRDVDAEGFVHWTVAGLRPDLGGLDEGAVPAGGVQAANDFGRPGWAGPCPPSGAHHYDLALYALSQASGVVQDEPGATAAARVEAAPALASAALSVTADAG